MAQHVQLREFTKDDLLTIYHLIQNTIDVSYHGAYPAEAVELFKNYHSEEQILSDATAGDTIIAECNRKILGTGTLLGTNIRRVYVNPLHQHDGTGKLIVQELERRALRNGTATIDLEASLVSRQFWESLGYVIQREDSIPVQNDKKLYYYQMTKTLDA